MHKFFPQKQSRRLVAISIVIFFLTRFAVIFFGSSRFSCESELYRGTEAYEIMSNLAWPILTYQAEFHTGGTLIASLIIIPFFMLFGKSLVSIKLVALVFSFVTFMLVYYFTYHCIKKPKAALLTLFWFVFAPPIYLIYSTVFLGEHYASQLFSFLAMILFYKMTDLNISRKRKIILSICFGLTCGFSTYFSYTFFITLATCLLVWFIMDKLFFLRRQFFIFALSALVGFTPRLLFNHAVNTTSFYVRENSLFDHVGVHIDVLVERLFFLFTFYLPHGLWLGDLGNVRNLPIMGASLGLLFLVSYVYIFKQKGSAFFNQSKFVKNRAFFLVFFYPLVFIILHSINDYISSFINSPLDFYDTIGDYSEFKYVFSIYPYLFIIISLFLTNKSFWQTKKKICVRVLPVVLCLFFWLLSLINVSKLTAIENYDAHVRRWRPYSYHLMGEQVARIFFRESLPEQIGYMEKIKMPYRNYAYFGFGLGATGWINDEASLTSILSLITQESHKYFVRALGVDCAEYLLEQGSRGDLNKSCPVFSYIPESLKQNYIEGIGLFFVRKPGEVPFKNRDKGYLSAFYRSYGVSALRFYRGDLNKAFFNIQEVPLDYQNDFISGFLTWEDYYMDFEIDKPKLQKLMIKHQSS